MAGRVEVSLPYQIRAAFAVAAYARRPCCRSCASEVISLRPVPWDFRSFHTNSSGFSSGEWRPQEIQCQLPLLRRDLSPKFPPLISKVRVAATAIVTVFLGSVEGRFSVPASFITAVARSLGQD